MSAPALARWPWRTAIGACVLVLPFLRFVLQNSYSPFRPEVLLGVVTLALLAFLLGLLARGWAFYAVIFALLVFAIAGTVEAMLWSLGLQPHGWLLPAAFLVVGVPMCAMRDVFFRLLVVFTLGAFAVDVGQFVFHSAPPHSVSPARLPAAAAAHVIYIVLDEHIGLAGLPDDIPECRRARGVIESVFLSHKFQVYPYAYSNYDSTVHSFSSILNFAALRSANEFLRADSPSKVSLGRNRLFASFHKRGYSIAVYQPRYPDYCGHAADCTANLFYPANTIRRIEDLPIPVLRKLVFIGCSYLESYVLVQKAVTRGLLRRIPQRIGPLSVEEVWPDRLARDIIGAQRPTLFFAHLLTPHYPYVYRRDGSLRDERQWINGFWGTEGISPSAYDRRYREYGEQLEYLSGQTDDFLRRLEGQPLYDSSLIIFQGDHGSRLHRTPPRPDVRELLDSYSALLAIKPPHARQGCVLPRKASILRVISELLGSGVDPLPSEADDLYNFDAGGHSFRVPGAKLWLDPARIAR